jgi:hypothetical protein
MNGNAEEMELKDRLSMIEAMIAEGRRKTESWGWVFLLWGVAYYVAIGWSIWGNHSSLAWSVTMMAAMILTFGLVAWRASRRRTKSQPETTTGRAVSAIWIAMGISMIVLLPALGIGGRSTSNVVVAVVAAMLGTSNAASSMILKWKLQFGCALVWWATAVVAAIGNEEQTLIALLTALFLCQIVFGAYAMVLESRRARQVVSHA